MAHCKFHDIRSSGLTSDCKSARSRLKQRIVHVEGTSAACAITEACRSADRTAAFRWAMPAENHVEQRGVAGAECRQDRGDAVDELGQDDRLVHVDHHYVGVPEAASLRMESSTSSCALP